MRIMAFDIGGTFIKSSLFTNNKELIHFKENPYILQGKDGVLQILHREIQSNKCDAIGISTTGLVDTKTGTITYGNDAIPNYTGTKLKEMLEKKYNIPVYVLNDVNAAALGEGNFGAAKNYNNYVCLTYGTGVGGAIVINNQIYEGNNGYAGEIGHIPIHPDGVKCVCGLKGCYNEYASSRGLVNSCMLYDKKLNNGKKIFDEFHKGNTIIKNKLDNWINEIIYGLVIVVHVFDPQIIVLGGGIMQQKYIINQIKIKIKDKILPSYNKIIITNAKLDNKAGLMGAVYYVMENLK